jgi:protoporphyrinogen oxidase
MFDDAFTVSDRWMIQAFIDKVYADNAGLISTDTETIPYAYAELYKKDWVMSHTKTTTWYNND